MKSEVLNDLTIRWMIRRDMPEVLRIENDSFEFSWIEDDFLACLLQRNCIGMVALLNGDVAGFMIYELCKSKLHVLNFAVAPRHRRKGIGTQMVTKLKNNLSQQRRKSLTLEIRESNLDGQLFFRSQRFLAVDVLRGHYEDCDEDAYVMQFDMDE